MNRSEEDADRADRPPCLDALDAGSDVWIDVDVRAVYAVEIHASFGDEVWERTPAEGRAAIEGALDGGGSPEGK